GLHLRWLDARKQMIDMHAVKMVNKNPDVFEEFSVTAACPQDADAVRAWVYSFRGATAEAVVDDVKIEILD
ncbi:MAG TPA: hypothetical protein PLE73_09680, partial [Spirochaetota bacterium]|nr:hypothetical protein [Spirochaetota bacterium]